MLSQLFADDPVLDSVARDLDRISRTRHESDPAVGKVQIALLAWDPACLPQFGVDGLYGDETAAAVVRFKHLELGVPLAEIVDDVGPQTVTRLDEIAAVAEGLDAWGFVAITTSVASSDEQASLRDAIARTGGTVLLGLASRALVVGGPRQTFEALAAMVGSTLSTLVTPSAPDLPADIDDETAELVRSWLTMLDPAYILDQADPHRHDESPAISGCVPEATS